MRRCVLPELMNVKSILLTSFLRIGPEQSNRDNGVFSCRLTVEEYRANSYTEIRSGLTLLPLNPRQFPSPAPEPSRVEGPPPERPSICAAATKLARPVPANFRVLS